MFLVYIEQQFMYDQENKVLWKIRLLLEYLIRHKEALVPSKITG